MDRTLKKAKRRNKRSESSATREPGNASRRTALTCRYCEHDGSKHLMRSGQPHFYRPATEAERRDPHMSCCTATLCRTAAPCWCGG